MSDRPDVERRRAAAEADLARAGEIDAPIVVVDYDESWPARFHEEATRLAGIVPGLELHHIGSTAVPGLAAKPVIDLMGQVEDLDAPLAALTGPGGYVLPEAYNEALSARRWLCRPSASHRTHHLHLVDSREQLSRRLAFRDALRADDSLAAEYAQLKRTLASRRSDDREAYTAAKGDFVARVLRRLE